MGPKCLREHSFRLRMKLSDTVKSVLHERTFTKQSTKKEPL